MVPCVLPAIGVRVRSMRANDAELLAALRSDVSTAQYQSWTVPYPLERAEELARSMDGVVDLQPGQWIEFAVADIDSDAYIGGVSLRLHSDGRTCEIGYTLSTAVRGRGIATVVSEHLIALAWERPHLHRIEASLHPDNHASARVLERLGFLDEGVSRGAYWVGDEVSDDLRYGMLRSDWDAWHARPQHQPGQVRLVEMSASNRDAVTNLRLHRSQHRFVSPMLNSIANALVPGYPPEKPVVTPWYRAVEADGVVVGFVMVADRVPGDPQQEDPFLWRLLIDRLHQGRGIGQHVVNAVIADRRAKGDRRLMVSWVEGHGSPARFYERLGFVRTGRITDDETEAALDLS
jgi:RimJ/RimL family protein N-acetyltransferase